MDLLVRIKRAVLAGQVVYTEKAELEMEIDQLRRPEVEESIIYAHAIYKTIRSITPHGRDYLHLIRGQSLSGIPVYTKGKLVARAGVDTYYVLIFNKRMN